jgi:hypothetical protein
MKSANVYEARKRQLTVWLNDEGNSDLLRHLYSRAIQLTERSLLTLKELADCAHKALSSSTATEKERADAAKAKLDSAMALVKEALLDLQKLEHGDLSFSLAMSKLVLAKATGFETKIDMKIQEVRVALDTALLQGASSLGNELIDKIWRPDESQFELDAVLEGLKEAVKMVPVLGHLLSGLEALHKVVRARSIARDAAVQHIRYIEDYCDALEIWLMTAQKTARALGSST